MRRVGFLLYFVSGVSMASGSTGLLDVSVLQQRECTANHGFQITAVADHLNPDGCTNKRVLELPCEHAAFAQMTSLAMTAYATKSKLQAWVSGCDTEGQAIVTAITVKE